ncbi:MAG TPA: hypothetical protein VHB21_01835 [Minicystis sp.]|nr:hypothetical protein [Minicystis sp.]
MCPDPSATVRAANVRATLEAFKFAPSVGRRLVEKHQLNTADLRPDNFILVQRWLDALREIQEEVGPTKLRDVGRLIVENADFPPHFTDAETMLMESNAIYRLNHRGDVGRYVVTRLPDRSIVVRCETPYPRMFEWGVIEGMTKNQRYKHPGKFSVEYEDGPKTGDLTCTIHVRRVG